jgi:hypothetical protein
VEHAPVQKIKDFDLERERGRVFPASSAFPGKDAPAGGGPVAEVRFPAPSCEQRRDRWRGSVAA